MTCTLFHSAPSPFVRKVRIVAAETGQALDLVPVSTTPVQPAAPLLEANPLGKVPAMRTPSGEMLYDSAVICRYLGEGSPLYPAGDALWRALRREALADGLIEAALLARYEAVLRPEPLRWPDWTDAQIAKVTRSLEVMATDPAQPDAPDIGDLATGCALAYLDFRYPQIDWRGAHPGLARLAEALNDRASFRETRPE